MSVAAMILPASRPLTRFVRSPKGILIGIFAALTLLAIATLGAEPVLRNVLLAAGAAAAIDLTVTAARGEKLGFPDGAILTGIIVGLLLRTQEPASTILLAVAVGLTSKHLIRTRWSNVLNPAAVGLVFAGVLLQAGQSWWGALPDLGILGASAVLITGCFLANRINKLPMVLVFWAAYFGLFTVAAIFGDADQVAGVFRAPDIHAALFFALFMLDDPPTSPVRYEDQVVYALIVATLAYFLLMTFGVVYYLPLALLAGNVWESARRIYAARSCKKSPLTAPGRN